MAWIHLTGHPGPTGTKLPCLLWSSFATRVFNLGVAQQKTKRKPPAFVFTSLTFPSNFWLIDCLCVVVFLVYVLTFCLFRQPMLVTKHSMLAIRVVVHHSRSHSLYAAVVGPENFLSRLITTSGHSLLILHIPAAMFHPPLSL